jgi:probable HAF family extracellular repeat protein
MSKRTGKSYSYSAATLLLVCLGLVVIVGHRQSASAASIPTYTISVTTSVSSAACNGLNASGQTTGQVNGTGGTFAMLNTDGVLTSLGSLNGSQGSDGLALNNSGQVVGWSYTSDMNFVTHNFLYSGGKVTDLYPLGLANPAVAQSNVINSSGEVVGYTTTSSTPLAEIYSGGKITTLGTLPGATGSIAFGINDNGDVAGGSGADAFLYKNGVMKSIGRLGTSATEGRLINNNDQIAGTAINDYTPLFFYSNGVMAPITSISRTNTTTPLAMTLQG